MTLKDIKRNYVSMQTRIAAASASALFFTVIGVAHGQTAGSPDRAVDLRSGPTPSIGVALRAKPRVKPGISADRDMSRLVAEKDDSGHSPGVYRGGMTDDDQGSRRAYGSFGIPYTTTRVEAPADYMIDEGLQVPVRDPNLLSLTFPYSAVGRLTVGNAQDNWFCSASVIAPGIVLTAAHCVTADNGGYTQNMHFWPGFYGGDFYTDDEVTTEQMAPYGAWAAFKVVAPAGYLDGTDPECGDADQNDIALLAIKPNKETYLVGEVVGWIPYAWNNYSFVSSPRTGDLSVAAVSTLGYPGMMDEGNIMQRSDGPAYLTSFCDEVQQLMQGTNLTGGSSGGPWVVNFSGRNPNLSGTALSGEESLMATVGVTSFGSFDPNHPKDNFASVFGQTSQYPETDYGGFGAGNIGSLMNTLCNAEHPDGGTLDENGYCSYDVIPPDPLAAK